MKEIELIATAAAGVESVVKHEVKKLGFKDITVDNGKIMFKGIYQVFPGQIYG